MNNGYKIFKNQQKPKAKHNWKDEIFPPNENSLLGKNEQGQFLDSKEAKYKLIKSFDIEWRQLRDIIPNPVIFEGVLDLSNLRFGSISYSYFYSTLYALSRFPSIFNKIILDEEYNEKGYYQVLFFIDGEFQIVYIDDYFPCIKNTNVPYFIKSSNFEFWAMLIEKAWAKVNGGYQNMINLWPIDLFRALTGEACEEIIIDNIEHEELLEIIDFANQTKGLCLCLSDNNEQFEKIGLLSHHFYIFLQFEKIELKNKKEIYLCKLLDPTGEVNWKGDWGNCSTLWTEEVKNQINKKVEKGEFWISTTDIKKYFIRLDICHMIYDGFSKSFHFTENLLLPKVFNFYLYEESLISVSLFPKDWHFNRELRNIDYPSSLIIAEYDKKTNSINNIISKYESNTSTEITKILNKGYYIVWAFVKYDSKIEIPDNVIKMKFTSDTKLSIQFISDDENFEVVKNIIYQKIKEENIDKINNNEIVYKTENSFEDSGLGYTICINPFDDIYQKWKINTYEVEGYIFLSPSNKKKFELIIGNYEYKVILGIKKNKYDEHWFNLKIEIYQYEEKINENLSNLEGGNEFFSKNHKNFELSDENPTFSYDEIKLIKKYPTYDHWKLFLEKYKNKYSFIIGELGKLSPLDNEYLDLVFIENKKSIYLGEADYIIRAGRGAMIFLDEGTIYIGYWNNGNQYKKGKVYDSKNNLVYEGEYKNGLKEGFGIYYYQNGEKYEGQFVNGIKEGKGIFYWEDGSKWEGNFKNNEMEGEGTFSDGDEKYISIYKNGELLDEN